MNSAFTDAVLAPPNDINACTARLMTLLALSSAFRVTDLLGGILRTALATPLAVPLALSFAFKSTFFPFTPLTAFFIPAVAAKTPPIGALKLIGTLNSLIFPFSIPEMSGSLGILNLKFVAPPVAIFGLDGAKVLKVGGFTGVGLLKSTFSALLVKFFILSSATLVSASNFTVAFLFLPTSLIFLLALLVFASTGTVAFFPFVALSIALVICPVLASNVRVFLTLSGRAFHNCSAVCISPFLKASVLEIRLNIIDLVFWSGIAWSIISICWRTSCPFSPPSNWNNIDLVFLSGILLNKACICVKAPIPSLLMMKSIVLVIFSSPNPRPLAIP